MDLFHEGVFKGNLILDLQVKKFEITSIIPCDVEESELNEFCNDIMCNNNDYDYEYDCGFDIQPNDTKP